MTNNMLHHHRWIALPSELLLLLLTLVCSLGTNAQNSDGSDGGGVEFQALDVNLINHGTAAASDSVKTAAKGTSRSVVAAHNAVRGSVLATNMQYVDQDSSLTRDVRTWLSQCSYSDDLVVHWNDVTYPYVNGFLATLPSPDSISGVISLINRKPTLDTYYRLLMKSDIRYFGCGSVKCPHLGSTFVACVYASRSELNLAKAPYESGEPCTECSSGIYWCNDNLCRDDCYTANAHCECQVDCGRDSTVSSNCSCLCPSGRGGNKCQESTETTATSCIDCDGDWGQGGTTLIVCVTLVLLVLLCVSLCLVLYHKKYRLSKLRAHSSSSSNSTQSSPTRRANIYTTSSSSSTSSSSPPSSFDPSKYPSPPPAYTSVNLTPDLDPPPYGFTASPTDAAEEVGHDGSIPPPPYPNQQVDV